MANGNGNGDTGSFSRTTISANTVVGWLVGVGAFSTLVGISYATLDNLAERVTSLEAGRAPMTIEGRFRIEQMEKAVNAQAEEQRRVWQRVSELQQQLNEEIRRSRDRDDALEYKPSGRRQ